MRKSLKAPWSDEHLKVLRELLRSGVSPLRAAVILKRSTVSVKDKARLLGTPFPDARKLGRSAKVAAAAPSDTGSGSS
jgi:hypothetical protein